MQNVKVLKFFVKKLLSEFSFCIKIEISIFYLKPNIISYGGLIYEIFRFYRY